MPTLPPLPEREATVSLPPTLRSPLLTVRAAPSAMTLSAVVSYVPPLTVMLVDAIATPEESLPPETVVVPVYPCVP